MFGGVGGGGGPPLWTVELAWAVGGKTAAQNLPCISTATKFRSVEMGEIHPSWEISSREHTPRFPMKSSNNKKASVTIQSPVDKVKAIQAIATAGHLELDVREGKSIPIWMSVAADKAGVATSRVASHLIPKLPFQNLASTAWKSPTGGKERYVFVPVWCLVHSAVRVM